jgi:capsular polysaccharide biosynthesis protein
MLRVFLKRRLPRNVSPRARWLALERSLHNAAVEAAFAKPAVSARRHYCVRSAAALSQAVTAEEFATRASGHVTAFPAATLPLPRPQVRGIDPARVQFRGPFLLPGSDQAPADFPAESKSPPLMLTSLPDALCLPDQIVLARDDAGEVFIVDASFSSPPERGNHPEILRLDADAFRIRRSRAHSRRLPGCYLFLDCYHRSHFGHFLVDVMSMTWAFDKARQLGIEGLQVLTTAKPAPFMFELLRAMGISREAVVPLRRPMQCARLLVADKCFLTQGYTSPAALATWRRIRDALDRGAGPERIYVSRSRQAIRRLGNETTVEAIFAARGFAIVHPEDLPIEQQVTLWANARLVAGSAGSNMFGLAFQRRLERVLQITSPNMVQFSELMMLAESESAATIYIGRAHGEDPHAPWSVAPADLEREVDRWLA